MLRLNFKRHFLSICLAGLVASLGLGSVARAADAKDGYEARIFEQGDKKLNYRLLKPTGYTPDKKYPLVLFLHGAGERGSDNAAQLRHGTADFAKAENQAKNPCFVIAPQCPSGKKWAEVDWGASRHEQPSEDSESLALTLGAIASLQKEFSIDARRLYVTGLSMGGYGTWDVIGRHPGMFAAAAPKCGGGDEKQASKMTQIPIWCFHGDADGAVKVERSRNMIKAIKDAGGKPLYTEYPGVGHDSWTATYRDPKFHEWLFAQTLPEKTEKK